MMIRASELRQKDVVSIKNGLFLGRVCDFDVSLPSPQIENLIIWGRPRCLGLLGRGKDIIIRWCDIELIGEDTILVRSDLEKKKKRRKR